MSALLEALRGTNSLLVITGAGISLASGIPTFRGEDPGAVWAEDVMEKGTRRFFRRDPGASWSWYLDRFSGLLDHAPNPAHTALVALERWMTAQGRDFLLVTQNVDCLHEAAGSRALVKVHGSVDRVRCGRVGCDNGAPKGSMLTSDADFSAFAADRSAENLPTCPLCGDYLRPHVLWFDEYYSGHHDYQIHRALTALKRAGVVLFVGTSFSVGITEMAVQTALQRGRQIFSIDPVSAPPHAGIEWVRQPSEEVLPALVAQLAG